MIVALISLNVYYNFGEYNSRRCPIDAETFLLLSVFVSVVLVSVLLHSVLITFRNASDLGVIVVMTLFPLTLPVVYFKTILLIYNNDK